MVTEREALRRLAEAWDLPGGMQDHIAGVHDCGCWADSTEEFGTALNEARAILATPAAPELDEELLREALERFGGLWQRSGVIDDDAKRLSAAYRAAAARKPECR